MKPYLQAFPDLPPLLAFCQYYLPHRFSAPFGDFHKEIAADFHSHDRIAFTTPPECGKSTLMNLGASIYLSVECGVPLILIISATGTTVGSTAAYWLDQIVEELTHNEKILADYPFLKERKSTRSTSHHTDLNWETKQKSGIKLPNNSQIIALGWNQVHRGLHPQYVILDDPESDETVSTEYQREKFFQKFTKVVLRMMRKDSSVKLVWIGSYINRYCILKRVIENDFPEERKASYASWIRKKFPAEVHKEDGEWDTFWPDSHWTKEALQAKRDEMTEVPYLTEFMHQPPDTEVETGFDSAWMHEYKLLDLASKSDRPHRDWIAVDAASGTKANADYRAWIHFRQFLDPKDDFEKLICIVDYGENRRPPEEVVATIINVMQKNDLKMPYVRNSKEGEGANWFEKELRRQWAEMKLVGRPNVVPISLPGNKAGGKMENWDKCLSWLPRHHFAVPVHKKERIREVLLNFPEIEKDDLVDAFVVGMKYAETYPVGHHGKRHRTILAWEYDEKNPEDAVVTGIPHRTSDGYITTVLNT